MPGQSHAHFLSAPLVPHQTPQAPRFGKERRQFGDPIAVAKNHPRFVPPPLSNNTNLSLPLKVVAPEADTAAKNASKIVFHAAGDTGGVHGTDVQQAISDAMESQFSAQAHGPAFFYNLGDVVYFNGQSNRYRDQFYEPYQFYRAPIFAIPGNHDGDTAVRRGDEPDTEPSLFGFMRNFVDSSPNSDFPYRDTMTQPYVYWTLQCPFVNIVGLYSNVEGSLDARGTNEQQAWLEGQLSSLPKDQFLLVAVHHPPYSLDASHGGSPDIVAALDRAMETTQRIPDAVLSGHVHNYQRFTRSIKGSRSGKPVPYVIAGAAGYANKFQLMHRLQTDPQNPPADKTKPIPKLPFKTTLADLVLSNYNETDPGFLRITADAHKLTIEYFLVPFEGGGPTLFDSVTV